MLPYERGMGGRENVSGRPRVWSGLPEFAQSCQVRAWDSGTHGRQRVGSSKSSQWGEAKLGLLGSWAPGLLSSSSNSRTTGAKRKRCDGTRSRRTLRRRAGARALAGAPGLLAALVALMPWWLWLCFLALFLLDAGLVWVLNASLPSMSRPASAGGHHQPAALASTPVPCRMHHSTLCSECPSSCGGCLNPPSVWTAMGVEVSVGRPDTDR